MKKLIIFALLLCSFTCIAQKAVKVEDMICTLDSFQRKCIRTVIEDCEKLKVRYGTQDGFSCPVYQDTDGWYFYIYIDIDRHVHYITLNNF